jgi:hypothetical protein
MRDICSCKYIAYRRSQFCITNSLKLTAVWNVQVEQEKEYVCANSFTYLLNHVLSQMCYLLYLLNIHNVYQYLP